MRAPTGATVETLDDHNPQFAFPARGFPQTLHRGRTLEFHCDWPVLEDDGIGAPFSFLYDSIIHHRGLQIDSGTLRAEVEADGMQSEVLREHRREQVLPGVLLHMIEAPVPIENAIDRPIRHRSRHPMRDTFALVDHLNNRDAPDRPGIERLPAGGGIKGRAIEVSGGAPAGCLEDAGSKVAEVAIVVVEPFGHSETDIVAERACGVAEGGSGRLQWRSHLPSKRP